MNTSEQLSTSHNHQLVTFVDINTYYLIGHDIFIEYKQKKKLNSTAEDWIGIFPLSWQTLEDCVARQNVPKPTRRNKKILQKVVRIPANSLQVAGTGDSYQLVYVTKDRKVAGISSTFTLEDDHGDQYDSELGQFELLATGSDNSDTSTCMYDSFFLVDELHNKKLDPASNVTKDVSEDDTICTEDGPAVAVNAELKEIETQDGTTDESPSQISEPKHCMDDVTLAIITHNDQRSLKTDFTVSPSGTAMMNHLDFVIDMEPEVREYIQNPVRSLLPVHPDQLAVLPYQPFNLFPQQTSPVITCAADPAKDNANLNALCNLLSEAPTPPQTQSDITPPKHSYNSTCRNCSKKNRELKISKGKVRRAKTEQKKILNELNQIKDHVEDQEMLLTEFSTQIKNLVHDKAQLVIANETFNGEISELTDITNSQARRIASKKKVISNNKRERKELEETIARMKGEQDSYELVIMMTDMERELLQQRCDFQECEAIELMEKYSASEALLDDIMYTLSVQGYTRLVDINGRTIDLTKKRGSRIELYGWSMETNKRDEMHMVNLAKQEEQIQNLQNELNTARVELDEKTNKLNWMKNIIKLQEDKNHELMDKVDHLMYCMAIAEEKEAALHSLLLQERRKNNLCQLKKRSQQVNKNVQTNATYTGQTDASCGTDKCYCMAPPNNFRSTVTFKEQTDNQASNVNEFERKGHKRVFNSDTKLFKSYSDALKFAAARNRSCENDYDKTREDPEGLHRDPNPTESSLLSGEMMRKLFDDTEPIAVPTVSSILKGSVLPSMYSPFERQPRQQDSGILRGNVLKNLFKSCSSDMSVKPQTSEIVNGNTLNKLFKENESSLQPQVSSILEDGTLKRLFRSSEESLSSQESSIFDGELLPNLFKSISNESIEVLDNPEFEVSLEPLFERHILSQNEYTRPLSLDEFTFLLDKALSIVFCQNKSDPSSSPVPEVLSGMESMQNVDSEPHIVPLLDEFSFPDVSQGPPPPETAQNILDQTLTQNDQDNTVADEGRAINSSPAINTPPSTPVEETLSAQTSSSNSQPIPKSQRKPRKFYSSASGSSRRRRNKRSM